MPDNPEDQMLAMRALLGRALDYIRMARDIAPLRHFDGAVTVDKLAMEAQSCLREARDTITDELSLEKINLEAL